MTLLRTLTSVTLAFALASCGGDRTETDISGEKVALPTIGSSGGALSTVAAKQLFGAKSFASTQSSAAFGSYSKGCLAGAEQLPETGPTWQAMRLSRNRNWAHPETIDYVQDLSRKAAQLPGWNGLYVGDMSQPRGGPMTSGHASHQVGLDADIWLRPATDMNLSRSARENISSISMRRQSGAS